jgi:hypothetical protein
MAASDISSSPAQSTSESISISIAIMKRYFGELPATKEVGGRPSSRQPRPPRNRRRNIEARRRNSGIAVAFRIRAHYSAGTSRRTLIRAARRAACARS